MAKAIVTIPVFLREEDDLETTMVAVESVRQTSGSGIEILVVDDGSPAKDLIAEMGDRCAKLDAEVIAKKVNSGFSKTVNFGLRRARDEGKDAVLLNADTEIISPDWFRSFRGTRDLQGRRAALAGALLVYSDHTIQHAGIYFSLLTRTFDHRYKHGPMNLPEALNKASVPVTGAFQYIRAETLETVGLYDEKFFMGWEDVDYCIRVNKADLECVYNPNVRAYHFEQKFRGHGRADDKLVNWQAKSFKLLCDKYADEPFGALVPDIW